MGLVDRGKHDSFHALERGTFPLVCDPRNPPYPFSPPPPPVSSPHQVPKLGAAEGHGVAGSEVVLADELA